VIKKSAQIGPFVVLATLAITAGITKWRVPRTQPIPDRDIPAPMPTKSGAGLAPPSLGDARANASVRMIHGDAHHTHRSTATGPREAKLVWKLALAGAIEAQIVTSPDESTFYAASLDGHLHAIDRQGKERWSVDLGERAYATPLVADDGTIYAGSDAKKLYAITPDGKTKWTLETGGEVDTGPAGAPDGTIVVACGSDVIGVRKGGDLVWRYSAKKKIFTSPAIADDGTIIVGSQDHHVHGIGARGERIFATDLGADVDGSAAIGDDGAIYVGTDAGEVVRLDAKGEIVWRANVGGFVRGTLSIARNGDVLAGVYGPQPRQVRIGPDGTVRGALAIQGTGAREFGVHGGALEDAAGKLFFGAQDDILYAVGTDGAVLFRFSAEGDIDAPVTLLSDGSLVFAADDGKVYYLAP
jgi:outer membrane protein assembly factor BamB